MKKQKGFTLIEVMIVVVIVAILAAVAIPSYQDSVRKTRRADAKEALTRIAALQERYFFTNNSYGTLAQLGVGSTSQEGHYTVAMVAPTASLNGSPIWCGATEATKYACFRITATSAGAQASDSECNQLSIDHVGKKTASKSGGADNSDVCW